MNQLLIICGPTATGKTNLALQLAKECNGELISADSRQVYKYMDVGTGKDRPKGMKVWGYDVVAPDEDFSVKQWLELARAAIKDIWARNKLPIVVGGTGLYLKNLITPAASINIPMDRKLREKLYQLDAKELEEKLKQVDRRRWERMNQSDQQNPRRLVRAIEINTYQALQGQTLPAGSDLNAYSDSLWIGLKTSTDKLYQRIKLRVEQRANGGMDEEVKRLMQLYPDWEKLPALTATGYGEWRQYVEGKTTRNQAINSWQKAEQQYARRQLTWFKKQPGIYWFDIAVKNWDNQARTLAIKWYGK